MTSSAAERRPPPAFGPGRMMMGAGGPPAKLDDFKGSSRRLLGMLSPDRALVTVMVLLGVASVALAVLGPWLLGRATDVVFSGVVGQRLQPGVSKAEAVEALRRQGSDRLADMLQSIDVVPGRGIDFDRLAHVLMLVLLVYLASALFSVMQGRLTALIVQRFVFRLREQVEAKLARLPLSYFDQQRGDVLSRATNDTDNVAMTLQQSMSQLVTALLTIIGVLVMMFWISPVLALIALVSVPVSILITTVIGKRSQPQFVKQWRSTGRLNGHIEEMITGHSVVKVFGREKESVETFNKHNDALFSASFRAQAISGLIQPAMMFVSNLNYVLVAVVV
jgi:ATP-binding cassette subfamily B multidrug efflux pump